MDHADDGGDNNNVYVYMGGKVPEHLRHTITHVRVHKSVKIITKRVFEDFRNLVSIEMHDGVEIIEAFALCNCHSLKGIKLPGVRVIGPYAFNGCRALTDVEFGDMLETIGHNAFGHCTSLRNIKIPKVRLIENNAFAACKYLTEVKLSKYLETIGERAFARCPRLRRIAFPLKDNLIAGDAFYECDDLSQVDLVGGIHKTISSLLLDSWRNEMNAFFDRINRDLPNIPRGKTAVIQRWIERVLQRIDHFKSEHYALLKEFTTLLELALWKAKLDESQDERALGSDQPTKKVKIDMKAARQEKRITSGASIVIKNVLPFLKLE